ncbi:MAG TPA: hypothetical protein VFZ34_24640 [Blastocatellia bacterium]|nr:hypothetical protein [Blastocatellia bacterium]
MEKTKPLRAKTITSDVPVISETALWGRLLDPVGEKLSPDAARYLLNLKFPASDVRRMQELAEKAQEGTLTLDEQIELDNYERVGHVLSVMKSKARKSLQNAPATH